MATLVLQAAGAFLGGFLGPVGSAVGTAAGALAGYVLDRALIDGTRRLEGPRLTGARPFTAEEGAPAARIYGTARVGGTLIWATRFEESATTRRAGAKGGPKVTEYSYFANVAFAMCEGPIAGVRRIWADGRELDCAGIEIRVHRGTEDQLPDPLIEAKQGAGRAPAYRGMAYVVFEHFPIDDYGNRIPQFQFEVMRPVGPLGERIRAVALIPGGTEYGLSPGPVTRELRPGETETLNRHVLFAGSDLVASLDELQAVCPYLEHVALVVAWYGDDLRAGACRIRPAVTDTDPAGFSQAWQVSGLTRDEATMVSSDGGGAAYGGSPSDRSVIDAIAEIRSRGLAVTLYPFVMIDVPAGNELPDPYGEAAQPAYPWRGRITAMPAPGQPGTADKTAAARTQVAAFCGDAAVEDFAAGTDTVAFTGDSGDWGYRRFVLHHAHLAAAAGGVDAFLIGSELRGLTTLRDEDDAFPFVEELRALAGDVRTIVGPETKITYGADWSEYFGHQPADGSGDVFFHLDELWADPNIDAVGIDNYMPLSDWRDADYSGGNPDGLRGPYDPAGLQVAVTAGEGFDWHYPSAEARRARERSPIGDGAYGKPWVYRYKDLAAWWSNAHFNRPGGIEYGAPTAWEPRSKPIWFTELGCAAADKGPNQPNVFADPKSSENALPYFSNGGRSDLAQRRYLEAHFNRWDPDGAAFEPDANPLSPEYGGRMVDVSRIYVWAWDARPFPAFPGRGDVWSDGGNWHLGHWLNGRLGTAAAGDLVNAILADHGLPAADVDGVHGSVHGYVIDSPQSARSALEPLVDLFGLAAEEDADGLRFRRDATAAGTPVEIGELISDGRAAAVERTRMPDHALPTEAILGFRDPLTEYQAGSARATRLGAAGRRQEGIAFSGVLEGGAGRALCEDWLKRAWSQRESISFAVPTPDPATGPGAIVRLPQTGAAGIDYLVTAVEDGLVRRVTARQVLTGPPAAWAPSIPPPPDAPAFGAGRPLALFLDLPMAGGAATDQFRIAAWRKPWRGHAAFASPEDTGFAARASIGRPANVGILTEPLGPGFAGRRDEAGVLTVRLFDGEAASVTALQLLNGANTVAVRSQAGAWELLQFQEAEEIEAGIWQFRRLLRGQLGTIDAMAVGAEVGADVVVLDDAVTPAGLTASECGLLLNWKVGRAGAEFSGAEFASSAETGGIRALLPLAPAHLNARKQGGDLALSWVRCGRIAADSWEASDIPLGEEAESYRIEIAAAGGATVRTATSAAPLWLYEAAGIAADFPSPPDEIDVTVSQLSAAVGWGVGATKRFALP